MYLREHEKLVTLEENRCYYCFVCKKHFFIKKGEQFIQNKHNKFVGRHVTCEHKSPPYKKTTQDPEAQIMRKSNNTKRRRAGGHGYSGGDGFISID